MSIVVARVLGSWKMKMPVVAVATFCSAIEVGLGLRA